MFAGSGIAQSQVPPPTPPKSSQKPEADPAQHNEAPAKDQRGTESLPLVIKVVPPTTVEPEPSKEHKETSDNTSAEWWLVYVTGVLCAITLALAFFTGWLWNATKKLVIGADNTAKHELRAYVGVVSVHIVDGDGAKDPFRGRFIIQNFGKTMAMNTTIWINGVMTDKEPVLFPLGDEDIKSTTVVMPNESLGGIEQDLPRTIEIVMEDSFYLWGKIEYTDVFKQPHWTKFRFVSYRRQHIPDEGGGSISFGFAVKTTGKDSNDADNN